MGKNKALVIDDEQIVLNNVKKILSRGNYAVDVSLSGLPGLEKAKQGEYDIALTDIPVPDMRSLIVLRGIKRVNPCLPIVFITGYRTVRSAVQAMELGAAGYRKKPFTPEEVPMVVASAPASSASHEAEEQGFIRVEELFKVLERAA